MMNNDFWSDYHNFAIQIYDPSSSSDDDEKCCWKVLYYCQIEDFQGNGFGQNKSPIDWFFPTSSDGGGESSSTFFMNYSEMKQIQQLDNNNNNNNVSPSTKTVKDYPLFIGNPYCFFEEEENSDSEEGEGNNSPSAWNVLNDDNGNDMYLHVTPETTLLSWDEVKEKEGVNPSSKIKEHYDIIEWFVNLSKFQLYLDPSTSDEYHEEEQKQQPQDIMEFNKKDENRLKLQGMGMQSQRKQTYENYLKVFLQRTQLFPKDVIVDNILPYVGNPTHLRNVRIHYSYGGNDKNNRNV